MAPGPAQELSAADRRTVLLAVRHGERLADARLRPHAVSIATEMLRSTRRWEWFHRHRWWVVAFFVVGAVLGAVALALDKGGAARVLNVVVSLFLLAVFLVADPLFTRWRANAALAVQRNADDAAESAP